MRAAVLFAFLVVVAAAAVDAATFYNQSRVIGFVRHGDRLLDHDFAHKAGKRGLVAVHNYRYPRWGAGGFISCIKVLDRWLNGSNADLYLNSGGVHFRSVSLSLRSKLGLGLMYDIQVWGR